MQVRHCQRTGAPLNPRRMRRLSLFLLAIVALVSIAGVRTIVLNRSQSVAAVAVPLNPDNLEQRKVGALTFLGAWHLRSENSDFGGFSALGRLPDGRFLALSDAGWMAAFRLTPKKDGGAAISDSFIARLPGAEGIGPDGEELTYQDRDSESLTRDADGRNYWVGYENRNAIRRMDSSFVRVEAKVQPAAMAKWPSNGGAEAIVKLADGRFLVFSETADITGGGTKGLLYTGDPTKHGAVSVPVRYIAPVDFRVTDAAQLPNGDVLLLNRALGLGGFSAKLVRVPLANIGGDGPIQGAVIATLTAPLTVDNMEGLLVEHVRVDGRERTYVWIISDDNYFGFQRTILMKFALADEKSSPPVPGFQSR